MKKSTWICGVGKNDADYECQPLIDGKRVACKYYSAWRGMIVRCYSRKRRVDLPTYKDCSVCDDWKIFSVFRSWMQTQNWQGKELDKDIILPGNKVYSPYVCAFVDHKTNTFVLDRKASRGNYMIGVSWDIERKKFRAQCNNPFTEKYENLGRFDTEMDAHRAWKRRKHELSCMLSETQQDFRVAESLRSRYL